MSKPEKRKNLKKIAVSTAVILLISVIAELVFFAAESLLANKDYPEKVYPVSDFVFYELVQTEDKGSYSCFSTLANDSYFELTGLGGIAARTIDFYMFRENNDNSEMVVRFLGKSDGVRGTFTAGIKEVSDGIYRAAANYDNIESLRIYPTEKTNVSVAFDGIKINSMLKTPRFSPCRLFLWAAVILGLCSLAASFVIRVKKPVTWLSAYFMLSACFALFAFLSVRLFSSAMFIGDILIPAALLGFTAFYAFLYFVSVRVKAFHGKALLLFIMSGIVFSFATAPLQVPDEGIHFSRSYAISMGCFGFDGKQDYPDEVNLLYDVFSENLKMYEKYHGMPSARSRIREYYSRLGQPFIGEKKAYSNALLILPYLPSAFGILLTRLISNNALFALYAGRLFNMLMTAFASFYALKRAKKYQIPLLSIVFFPLTIFLASSTSYDAMVLAALILFLGVLSSKYITKKDYLIMLISFALIIMVKPLYLPLSLLLFTMPKEDFRFRTKPLVLFAILIISGIALWQASLAYANLFSKYIIPSEILPGVDKKAQVSFIILNPLRFIIVSVVDGFRKSFYIGEHGLFGHLDLIAPLTTVLSPVIFTVCSVFSAGEMKNLKKGARNIFFMLLIIFYFAVSAGFYVADSGLGGSTILGIQVRYFIPCLFLISALLGKTASRFLRPLKNTEINRELSLWLYFSGSLIAAAEVFAGYYL